MITVYVYGLDQFVVGDYSRDHTENIANLFEIETDLLNFYAPSGIMFHKGVEQTSWNVIVVVKAPKKYKVFEKEVSEYFFRTMSLFSIHIVIEFEYYEEDSRYERLNTKYPRYIKEENVKSSSSFEDYDDFNLDDEEENSTDDEELDINNEEDIYLGNAFENFEEKLAEKEKNKN